MNKRYQTQWAAQFYVAAELTRRGYLVSFTLGNAPATDLHVMSGDGQRSFRVECKGAFGNRPQPPGWWTKCPRFPKDLFFCFVYIRDEEHPRFFILTSRETHEMVKKAKENDVLHWKPISDRKGNFENRWDKLPGSLVRR